MTLLGWGRFGTHRHDPKGPHSLGGSPTGTLGDRQMLIDDDRIEALRQEYDHCFACGRANPVGLGLDGFQVVDGEVRVGFKPKPDFAGFADVLHGGIVAAALDEILAWAGILGEGLLTVTATLDIRFRRPAPPHAIYQLRGRVLSRSGSRLKMSGEMTSDGATIAEATGLYLVHRDLN